MLFQFIKDVAVDWDDTKILSINQEIIFTLLEKGKVQKIGL